MTTKEHRADQCAAPDCARRPRPFSRYCPHHWENIRRTRDLQGRIVTRGELRVHRHLAAAFIAANADHGATLVAVRFMASMLEPFEKARFLGGEFERLRVAGVGPEEMLASALAWQSWMEWSVHPVSDACSDANLGRAVIGTVRGRTRISRNGKRYSVRIRGTHAEALGRHIRLTIGLYLLTAARAIRQDLDASTPARDAIREALTVPFQSMEIEDDEKPS